MERITCLALGTFLICGGIAGVLATGLVPAGLVDLTERQLEKKPYIVTRPSDNLVEVSEDKWFLVPILYGDFDLQMDIEVSEGTELDVLLRQVEPRIVADQLLPFAGRFSVLRLSTDGDDVGWRTRDEALLGPSGNGVNITAGHLATVWIQARGRLLTANVAGKVQPSFLAEDEYGMMAMVAKGGKAVVHRFELTPIDGPPMWPWSRWLWCTSGVLGAAVVSLLAMIASRRWRLFWAGPSLVVFTWLLVRGVDLDLAFPTFAGLSMALILPLLLATVIVVTPRTKLKWLMAPLVLIALLAANRNAVRWPGLLGTFSKAVQSSFGAVQSVVVDVAKVTDSTRIDDVFGAKAGAQISEAHGLLVRSPSGLIGVDTETPCVFMLGGQLLYDQGMPGDHLALQLGLQLRGQLRKAVEVPCLPTVDGYSSQQWQLFERFFQPFEPDVLVLGIGADECALTEDGAGPRSSRAEMRDTIRAARRSCEQQGRQLVLFAAAGLPSDLMLALREQEASGLPLVVALEGRPSIDTARQLAEVCKPFLK